MAASSFAEFDESKEDWLSYTERMQQYFVVNGVREDGQRTTLLSTCGPATYQLIKDLVAPEKLTYCEEVWRTCLVGECMQDAACSPHWLCNGFIFTQGGKWKQETIPQYVAILRRLSTNCNFADALEDMQQDRLVCGLRDAELQRRLLSEKDLTFQRAFDICQAHEVAVRDTLKSAADMSWRASQSEIREGGGRLHWQGVRSASQGDVFQVWTLSSAKGLPIKECWVFRMW